MTPLGAVHFIHLGGPLLWQHWRAITTAEVHEAPRVVWTVNPDVIEEVEARPLNVPAWLADHPIGLANVKDYYAWSILWEHGGLYLDLDTVSLRPVWDLLPPGRDVVVSTEWPDPWNWQHKWNSATVVGRKGSHVLRALQSASLQVLKRGEARWGKTGPHLLTEILPKYPDSYVAADFPVLSGWRDDTIQDYYDGEPPGPDVRVVHCYASGHRAAFEHDRWWPA